MDRLVKLSASQVSPVSLCYFLSVPISCWFQAFPWNREWTCETLRRYHLTVWDSEWRLGLNPEQEDRIHEIPLKNKNAYCIRPNYVKSSLQLFPFSGNGEVVLSLRKIRGVEWKTLVTKGIYSINHLWLIIKTALLAFTYFRQGTSHQQNWQCVEASLGKYIKTRIRNDRFRIFKVHLTPPPPKEKIFFLPAEMKLCNIHIKNLILLSVSWYF